jgi:hypothetical protein
MRAILKIKARVIKNEYGQAVLVLRCPFCGKEHTHTCDGPAPVYGYRASHCTGLHDKNLEYELVAISS